MLKESIRRLGCAALRRLNRRCGGGVLSVADTLGAISPGPDSEAGSAGIIFSMDRAMQLHALLGSYHDQVRRPGSLSVLFRATTDAHAAAYREVEWEYSQHGICFVQQASRASFRPDLLALLDGVSGGHIFFLVDDNLFIEPVDLSLLTSLSTSFSIPTMRMGANLRRSYTVQKDQRLPVFSTLQVAAEGKLSEFLAWRWSEGELDWGYPLSVDGHVFLLSDIMALVQNTDFDSPNTLEGSIQKYLPLFRDRIGICYRKSALINIPYNRVQDDVENIHGEVHQDWLMEQWQKGKRIDRASYYGLENASAHQEMELRLMNEGKRA